MNSKKIRLIAASVLIGLMLLYVYRYHLPTSPDGMVHKDAQAVVLIDARALEAHMIKDVLLHPLSYIGGAEQPDREEISQPSSVNLLDCLELPRGLAFSQIGAEEKVWVSNDIGIRDETLLRTYLEEKGYKLLSDSDNSIFVKEKLYLSISGNHARLGWGEAVKVPALSDHTNAYLTVGDKLYDAIDKSGSDITYIEERST